MPFYSSNRRTWERSANPRGGRSSSYGQWAGDRSFIDEPFSPRPQRREDGRMEGIDTFLDSGRPEPTASPVDLPQMEGPFQSGYGEGSSPQTASLDEGWSNLYRKQEEKKKAQQLAKHERIWAQQDREDWEDAHQDWKRGGQSAIGDWYRQARRALRRRKFGSRGDRRRAMEDLRFERNRRRKSLRKESRARRRRKRRGETSRSRREQRRATRERLGG